MQCAHESCGYLLGVQAYSKMCRFAATRRACNCRPVKVNKTAHYLCVSLSRSICALPVRFTLSIDLSVSCSARRPARGPRVVEVRGPAAAARVADWCACSRTPCRHSAATCGHLCDHVLGHEQLVDAIARASWPRGAFAQPPSHPWKPDLYCSLPPWPPSSP